VWERSFAAQLERSKVFVPQPVRRFWFSASPIVELYQIGDADFSFSYAPHQVRAHGCREISPLNFGH
jgi:hypothetical protein